MDQTTKAGELVCLTFDNRFTRELPADPDQSNQRRQVKGACFSRVMPRQASSPRLVAYSREVAELLGIPESACTSEQFLRVFAGSEVLPAMDPYASCYGGHQFGNWAGQLGDGRAINLGEVVNGNGEYWTIQLKGAGETPYSRTADGLAVLRSSIREFLCSEAMYHLGVPTTRALSLIETGDKVNRDMFYDGNPRLEPGAVVCRVAPSFIRFGNFQLFAWRKEFQELKQLADFCIRTDFPHLVDGGRGPIGKEVYGQWFEEICRRTAEMVIHWMRVGFVHGVMNTDNMSVLGLTIDYGPYGWLEDYNPGWTPNTTDAQGRRYRYGQQPQVALWNLEQFARSLSSLFDNLEPLQRGLDSYAETYNRRWTETLAAKLGLAAYEPETDDELMQDMQSMLIKTEADMTLFYRGLAKLPRRDELGDLRDQALVAPLAEVFYQYDSLTGQQVQQVGAWLRHYNDRLNKDVRLGRTSDEQRVTAMNKVNPKYVFRNYLAQLAVDKAEQGDYAMVEELLDTLRRPYDDQPGKEHLAAKRPEWARHKPGCSMLSCSS
jgi:uncharacterized protein YdiU (UPF0061 family)